MASLGGVSLHVSKLPPRCPFLANLCKEPHLCFSLPLELLFILQPLRLTRK